MQENIYKKFMEEIIKKIETCNEIVEQGLITLTEYTKCINAYSNILVEVDKLRRENKWIEEQ